MEEGKKASNFSLKDKDGKAHSLNWENTKYTVLYFYPKDNTPGCVMEAKEFNKDLNKFKEIGASIIGIGGGNETSKSKFVSKHKLKLLLLSDPDFKVSTKYGVYGEKAFMGKKYMGISRVTFVLDQDKKIMIGRL